MQSSAKTGIYSRTLRELEDGYFAEEVFCKINIVALIVKLQGSSSQYSINM